MKYIVKLNEGKDIIDLCYAIKDIGKVIPTEYKEIEDVLTRPIEEALEYIEEEIKNMPLNGTKIRLLEIKDILEGGKNDNTRTNI
jgi:hypothetical protein